MKLRTFLAAAAIFLASCSSEKITWVALGDSITYLNDHLDETGNRVTKGYMTLITEQLPNVEYINHGYNGWTAVGIASKINELGLPKAHIYSIFLGTNDWGSGQPIGTMDDYMDRNGSTVYGAFGIIIDTLRSLNPSAKIVLITPMQRGDFVYINDYHNNAHGSYQANTGRQLNEIANAIENIAAHEGVDIVDLYHDSGITQENMVNFKWLKDTSGQYQKYNYPDYVGIPFDPDQDEYPYPVEAINMTYDGLHPSDKGYKVITEMLIGKIKN